MSLSTPHRSESTPSLSQMKVAEYIVKRVAEEGVGHVFMLPGGGAMHLNNALAKQPGVDFVCNLHEQASAIAAEAYCRVTGNLGVAMVTTGPGGTNAVTGVACAWLDSTPVLFISGQAKRSDLIGDSGLRQLGVQEIDIVSIVKPITKYAVTIMDPLEIRYHVEKAIWLARNGRPGPVWLDIPLDVQSTIVDVDALEGFIPPSPIDDSVELAVAVRKTIQLLKASHRPVLLMGNGIRVAGAIEEFDQIVEKLCIPVLTTCPGLDLIAESHPRFVGRPGAIAPRGANFALQNSDYLLSVGARLDMAMVGYSHRSFARCATKVIVDVDPAELAKLDMDIAVPAAFDAKAFAQEMLRQLTDEAPGDWSNWNAKCQAWKTNYPVITDEHRQCPEFVSTYAFTEVLSQQMSEGQTLIVGSSGAAIEIVFLCLQVKKGQRIFHNRGTGSMGLGLPQAIGACLARGGEPTILVEGDGSFQLNIQELQTVVTHNLPIKMFILNNDGFASIRNSQNTHFGDLIGADKSSGLELPDVVKVANAYGIRTERITSQSEVAEVMQRVMNSEGPVLCEVLIQPLEIRAPSIASRQRPDGTMGSSALEDLWPFLSREEFATNMIVPILEP